MASSVEGDLISHLRGGEFGPPDGVGFATLLEADFVRFDDMVFRKTVFDPGTAAKRLKRESREKVQREINHVHLAYAVDLRVQREWAQELESGWPEG